MATEEPNRPARRTPGASVSSSARSISLVLELPILLVGCIAIGGGIGYLLDKWAHFSALFTLLLGGLGFAAGITAVLRRLSSEEKREERGG